MALLCYNEYAAKGANKTEIFWTGKLDDKKPITADDKKPVLEVRVAKNKFSHQLGYIYYKHDIDTTCYIEEHNEANYNKWERKSV